MVNEFRIKLLFNKSIKENNNYKIYIDDERPIKNCIKSSLRDGPVEHRKVPEA
jgi:hypothetical protein